MMTLSLLLAASAALVVATPDTNTTEQGARADREQWYRDAKLGVFVHWGLYAIPGQGEWVMNRCGMSAEEYAKLAAQWQPEVGCEEKMVEAAAKMGAKYMVFTTRHHDGFALFASKANAFNAMNAPAKRDHVRFYAEACRKNGIKVGFYYSLGDWRLAKKDPAAMKRQAWAELEQLMTDYGRVDILWYDGAGGSTGVKENVAAFWESERLNAQVRRWQPGILINDRADVPGDFKTIEGRNIPRPPKGWEGRPWEACLTLQDDDWSFWGYCNHTAFRKTPEQIVCQLLHVLELDGNLIVNIGPDGKGRVDAWQRNLLANVGAWVSRHADAVYGVRATTVATTMPLSNGWTGNSCGFFTKKADRYFLYLHAWPGTETHFPCFKEKITSATLDGRPLAIVQDRGTLTLRGLPAEPPADICPVVELR